MSEYVNKIAYECVCVCESACQHCVCLCRHKCVWASVCVRAHKRERQRVIFSLTVHVKDDMFSTPHRKTDTCTELLAKNGRERRKGNGRGGGGNSRPCQNKQGLTVALIKDPPSSERSQQNFSKAAVLVLFTTPPLPPALTWSSGCRYYKPYSCYVAS